MQMLAPNDQISIFVHGVGREFGWPGDAAFAPCRQAGRAGACVALPAAWPGRPVAESEAMTDGEVGQAGAAGGSARHIPVLLGEVIAHLALHDGGVYIDGTFGAGGYSAALLAAADTRVVGIDRDPAAIAAAQSQAVAAAGRLTLVRSEFAALDRIAHDLGLES